MPKPFKGTINLDVRDSVPDWDAFTADRAPDGAPNVLVVLYDLLGERSRTLLDELKSWMSAHNAAIMAVITLVIGVKLLGDGIAGL